MQQRERLNSKVCFIAGAGHSGSTVLGMVLGSHPECFYAGEAGKTRFIGDERKDERKRVCKLCGPACPIWGGFALPEGVDLYEELSRRTARPVVVDSSKGLDWIEGQLATIAALSTAPHLLYLQRDGRAVLASRIRKYPDRPPREHVLKWAERIRQTSALYERFRGPKTKVRYEVFATDPEGETRRICELLGLAFVPGMLRFYEHEHHPLGGNNGAQFLVARVRGAAPDRPYGRLSARNREYYEAHERGIRRDDRWRSELTGRALELFEELGGELNAESRWDG